jgi:hypothetical protein
VDPDCADATADSCEECGGTGSCAQQEADCSLIRSENNAICEFPDTWTCSPEFWNAGDECDCGCGHWDPDCADLSADSCDFCFATGSCAESEINCDTIDPTMNWLCQ